MVDRGALDQLRMFVLRAAQPKHEQTLSEHRFEVGIHGLVFADLAVDVLHGPSEGVASAHQLFFSALGELPDLICFVHAADVLRFFAFFLVLELDVA